jgi:hypothetical protein
MSGQAIMTTRMLHNQIVRVLGVSLSREINGGIDTSASEVPGAVA